MRSIGIVGVILIMLGILALAYHGITYTRKETILNHAGGEYQQTVPLPPVIGITAVVGGLILLAVGCRE
jgi:uncharacterized membrane protein YidH (DUF202 family)